ncbi:MAG: single-stranded-DNA-specific exonuclease RecJ [Leptospira sp.]|nr:single-stranded-DNA-specific exonuclease RecJ [Leptospira sp.]
MHHVTKVLFGPTPAEIRAQTTSKKPLLRYFVDRREELKILPPHEFLQTSFAFLHSPFSLPDILETVECILNAHKNNKHILLYGDRDSDGVSSTCLLAFFLKSHPYFQDLKLTVVTSSDSDPYGLCTEAIQKIKKINPDILITLDFGSSQGDEIDSLTKMGMQVIVLDHHEIPIRIPEKTFLISPRRIDSKYPEKKICTAVISFKLIHAILFRLSDEFGKVYIKKDPAGDTYFRNGLIVSLSENEIAEYQLHPYPSRDTFNKNEIPLDEERFLFFYQNNQIPGSYDSLLEEVDLAGIGTITDMMPLTGENRMIVKLAILSLRKSLDPEFQSKRFGTRALLNELKLSKDKLSTKDLGWSIGPALNAAGRMGKTEEAVKLLLSEDINIATKRARDLLQINEDRKERTKRNVDRMERYFLRKPERTEKPIVFCYEPDMEPGVSGIVATKMINTYKRPAIFLTPDNGDARGSIRCYGKENALGLLNSLSDLFLHYGGHPEAAGFSILLENIPKLESILYTKAEQWLNDSHSNKNEYDYITDLTIRPEEINDKLFKEWKDLEPFGQGNPDIKLGLKAVKAFHLTPLSGGKHIKFHCMGSGSLKYMIWNKGDEFQNLISKVDTIDLVGSLETNTFRGQTSLQFMVEWFGKANSDLMN